MEGLGLTNALRSYQQGMAWHQQQQDQERTNRLQDLADQADKAAGDVLEGSRAEWALNGAQGQWQPSDTTMLKAAEARGRAFAKGGDWSNYLKNEATVQGQRVRVRASALQQYQNDGDAARLLQTVYPTVFDGKEVTAVEKVGGMPALASIDRGATPAVLKFKLSDGTESELPADQLVRMVKTTLTDPVAMAQKEIEANFLRTKAEIEGDKEVRVAREKGAQERQTEDVKGRNSLTLEDRKGRNALGLADVKFGYDQVLHDKDNTSREKVGAGNNAATRYSADVAGDTRVEAAGLRSAGGGGGGSKGLLKTASDADGNVILYFRDGTTKKAADPETGKPLKAGDWGTRIDRLARTLGDAPANFGKSPAELRQIAADTLASGAAKPAAPAASGPGLSSFDGTGSRPALSTFLKK